MPVRSNVVFAMTLLASTVVDVIAPAGRAVAQVEEILVTARKRDEALFDIPLAVNAFSARDIESLGARNLQDLAQFSPGLYFTQQGGVRPSRLDQVLRFRGMDTNTTNPTQQLATMFVDGVFVASGAQAIGLDDVERVEVIRGPQSAFFGRSTFSGAVNYVTRKPSDVLGGRINAEYATHSQKEVSAAIEGPIVSDRLTARLNVRLYDKNGQYDNAADAASRLGAENTKSIAGTLYLAPGDGFRVMARATYFRDADGPEAGVQIGANRHNCPVNPATGPCVLQTHFLGVLPRLTAVEIGVNTTLTPLQRQVLIDNSRNFPSIKPAGFIDAVGLERKTLRTSLSLDWEIANGITLSSITGWNTEDANTLTDPDGRPSTTISWLAFAERFIRDASQEVRVASALNQRLTWLIGANYFDLSQKSAGRAFWSQQPPDGFVQFSDATPNRTAVTTRGLFGSLGYDILDNLNLTVEGRYQDDRIKIKSTVVTAGVLANNPEIGDSFKNFMPRVILDFEPVANTTLYATYAKGNRPGTFNAGLLSLTAAERTEVQRQTGSGLSVDEEELLNYEIGYKERLFGGRLTSSLALYYMEWKNQQTRGQAVLPAANLPLGGLCVVNCRFFNTVTAVGKSDLKGVEWQGTAQFTKMLNLAATFAVTDSIYKVFECVFCQRVTNLFTQTGNRMPRVPKYSGTVSMDLRDELLGDYEWFARSDFIWATRTYEEAFNLAWAGPRTDVNLRAGVQSQDTRIEVFVTNALEDKDYPAAARNSDLFDPGFRLFSAGVTLPPKRVFGARASYAF